MRFPRLFSLLLSCLIVTSCHDERKNTNTGIRREDFATWNKKEYSLSGRKIRHEIDSL